MEAEERPNKLRKLSHGEIEPIESESHPLNNPTSNDPTPYDHTNDADLHVELVKEAPLDLSSSHTVKADNEESSRNVQASPPSQPLSKNQLKKLRKRQEWEAGKADRKAKRKEKDKEKKERQREERVQQRQQQQHGSSLSNNNAAVAPQNSSSHNRKRPQHPVRAPITLMLDCGFDDKMTEKELISLASQLTRCYSDNSRAPYQANLVVCSWGGQLKHRFDTVLNANYQNWKGVEFTPDDFVTASARSQSSLLANTHNVDKRWTLNGASNNHLPPPTPSSPTKPATTTTTTTITEEEIDQAGEIIYLTSDSPHTLTTLSQNSTYIIGGLVDRNRHKGICFHRATSNGIKTAKLPIAEFMDMQSRKVLATNHVVEIMVRWLEVGDWGKAFLSVIPKRKGGRLRGNMNGKEEGEEGEGGGDDGVQGREEEEDGVDVEGDNDEVVGEGDVNLIVDVDDDHASGGDDIDDVGNDNSIEKEGGNLVETDLQDKDKSKS